MFYIRLSGVNGDLRERILIFCQHNIDGTIAPHFSSV